MTATTAERRPGVRTARSTPRETSGRALFAVFVLEVLSVTVLQKFGLPVGGTVMELAVFATWAGIAVLVVDRTIAVDPVRMALYALFAAVAAGSQLLGGQPFSPNSLLLALALYLPFVLRFDVDVAFYRRCLKAFQTVALVIGLLVVVQQLMQLTLGHGSWPDLDRLVPERFLFPGYNYLQPVSYGSRFFKPNAFLFLEDSFVSQFMAIALLIEVTLFQRLSRVVVFALVLLICFAGTGLLLLAICAPFLLPKLTPRAIVALLIGGVIVAVLAGAVGWYGQVHQRFGEIGVQGSSGYYRFNVPFQIVGRMAGDPRYIFTGHGAGSTGAGAGQDVAGFILAPFAKIIYEYGFLTFFAFYAFFAYCLFAGAPSLIVALALFAFYNLGGGGFVVPVYVVTCWVLGVLLRVAPPQRERLAEAPGRARTVRSAASRAAWRS